MSTRKWMLVGSILLASAIVIVVAIGVLDGQPRPSVESTAPTPVLAVGSDLSSQPIIESQAATPSATPRITVTSTPSVTPTFLPLEPTQLTVEGSSTPSEIPPATAAVATVAGSQLSEPFDLPSGLYRVTLRTDGGFTVMQPIVEDGACSEFPLFGTWSGPFEGSASYRSTGCQVRFEVVGIQDTWSVEVALEVTVTSPIFPITISGGGPATSDIIDLHEGEYNIHFTTGSPALVTPIIRDGLCLERPVIVATQPGSYDAAYISTGCKLLFQISDAAAEWILVIELKG